MQTKLTARIVAALNSDIDLEIKIYAIPYLPSNLKGRLGVELRSKNTVMNRLLDISRFVDDESPFEDLADKLLVKTLDELLPKLWNDTVKLNAYQKGIKTQKGWWTSYTDSMRRHEATGATPIEGGAML